MTRNSFALPFMNFMLIAWVVTQWDGETESGDLAKVLFWLGSAPLAAMTLYTIGRYSRNCVDVLSKRMHGKMAKRELSEKCAVIVVKERFLLDEWSPRRSFLFPSAVLAPHCTPPVTVFTLALVISIVANVLTNACFLFRFFFCG